MSTQKSRARVELLRGTLDLLILKTLLFGPTHGHAIAKAIERNSDDVLQVEQGSLYPALHRLERDGLVQGRWDRSPSGQNRRYYHITQAGLRQLESMLHEWNRFSQAVNLVARSVNSSAPGRARER